MLVFLEEKVAQRLRRAAGDAFGAGELRHQQSAAAQPANHAAEQRVGDAGHGREHRRRPDGQVADLELFGNHLFNFSVTSRVRLGFLVAGIRKIEARLPRSRLAQLFLAGLQVMIELQEFSLQRTTVGGPFLVARFGRQCGADRGHF